MKIIFLFRGQDTETYSTFNARMHSLAKEITEQHKPKKLWLTLTEEKPPALSIIPFKKGKIAAISVVTAEPWPTDKYRNTEGFSGMYDASEAKPVSYMKCWDTGTVTPGICLLTLFRKKDGITYEKFIDRWHNSHTPLSLRIHPLWHYNRNVVKSIEHTTGLECDGIVEEHFRERKDLMNPFRFFGNAAVIIGRMISVYTDTNAFLDYGTIEPWLTREYIYA